MSFVELNPENVVAAGNATAATAGEWEAWAGASESALRTSASSAMDPVVTPAIEGFLASINPAMKSMAPRANNLGVNATSASHTMSNSDGESTQLLSSHGDTVQAQSSALSRPITA